MRKHKAKRAAPNGTALVVALRHCEARSRPDTLLLWDLLRKEIFQIMKKIVQKSLISHLLDFSN
jgi:hypothetical protein